MTRTYSKEHLILSRFNSIPTDPIILAKGLWNNPEWLARKIELFDSYFLPSLKNQTCKKFKLVLSCDSETPPTIIQHLSRNAEIHYDDIGTYPIPTGCWTTRADSDDMLHAKFVEKIQSQVCTTPTLIDVDTGFLNTRTGKTGKIIRPANTSQFLSVARSTKDLNCYCASHSNVHLKFPNQIRLRFIGGLQVIHNQNITTTSDTYTTENSTPAKIDLTAYGQ